MAVDKEELKRNAFTFVSEQPMGVIASVSPDSIPEAASVNYYLDQDWVIYILTDKDSRKVQNLRQNPHVAFVVGTTLVANTAQMQGTAEIIDTANSSYEELHKKLAESKRLDRDPMYNMFGSNYVILKIKIDWLRWLYFEPGTGNPLYTILIP